MKKSMTKIVWKKFEIMEATKGEDVSKKFLQKKKVTGISIDTRSLKVTFGQVAKVPKVSFAKPV